MHEMSSKCNIKVKLSFEFQESLLSFSGIHKEFKIYVETIVKYVYEILICLKYW